MGTTDEMPSIQSRLLALGCITLGCTMIGNIYGFYYVKCFLNYYHIEESWFQIAQMVYLVWNTVNDPLFAYLQDNTDYTCTQSRRVNILFLSPFFALAFLIPWFPWGHAGASPPWLIGVHLIVTLCAWDTVSTCIGLSKNCLNAELALDYETRIRVCRYNHIANLLGSTSVFVVQYVSNGLEDFRAFQSTCVVLAIISCLLTRYGAQRAFTERELNQMRESDTTCSETSKTSIESGSFFKLTKQLLTNRDMVCLISVIFLQHIHAKSINSFLAIVCDQLIPKGAIPELVRSAFYSGVFMVTKVTTIVCLSIVRRYGYYKIAMTGYVLKVIMGTVYYMLDIMSPWALIFFYFIDVFTADGMGAFHALALSDISDSDARIHNREHPITAMIHGTISFIVKPTISLTPMFVVNILNRHGYEKSKRGALDPGQQESLNRVMFNILCFFPIIVGSIQAFVWSFYTIRRTRVRETGLMGDDCTNDDEF